MGRWRRSGRMAAPGRLAAVLVLWGALACGQAQVTPRPDLGWCCDTGADAGADPFPGDAGDDLPAPGDPGVDGAPDDGPASDPGLPADPGPGDDGEDPGDDPGLARDPGPEDPAFDPGPSDLMPEVFADGPLEAVEDPGAPDPGSPDPGPVDPGPPDPGAPDPGTDPGPAVPLPGFGAITGDCGVLDDAEWGSASPFFFRNSIDFGTAAYDPSLLTPDGQEVIADGNLGGSSVESEALAVDVLVRCELADLWKTEGEIDYLDAGGKKTDELVRLDGRTVGVSVVRAFLFPLGTPYTAAEADRVLRKKLSDIQLSQKNADPANAWSRSMLSVLAFDDAAADLVRAAWDALEPAVRGDAIVLVTVTNGQDAFAYP